MLNARALQFEDAAPTASTHPHTTTPAKILIANDAQANRTLLFNTIKSHGYTVSYAPVGTAALQVAARVKPDMILLNLAIQQWDALETCCRLKSNPHLADVPIIFLSERRDSASILDSFHAGASDFITVPFQDDELIARIEAHLRPARLVRQLKERVQHLEMAKPHAASPAPPTPPTENLAANAPAAKNPATPPLALHDVDGTQNIIGITELPLNLHQTESLLIQRALTETRGNVAKAARLLGINRTRIYRLFNESAIHRVTPERKSDLSA